MSDDTFDRRRALGLLAALGGAVTLGGSALLGKALAAPAPSPAPANAMANLPWPYRHVDPDAAGQRAFEGCKKGHCMFGTFDAIWMLAPRPAWAAMRRAAPWRTCGPSKAAPPAIPTKP